MVEIYNKDAIIKIAIIAAMSNLSWASDTKPMEIETQDGWSEISTEVLQLLASVGMDTTILNMDKYLIAKAIWGIDRTALDNALAN